MFFETSEELNQYISGISGGKAILSFSCGKDSIAAWIAMKPYFHQITPYYLYLVPELSFVERALTYYEEFFGTHIIRLPHPSLYRMLNNFIFQAPENCATVEQADLPDFSYDDINLIIKQDCGLDEETIYTASGVRARDSLNRWAVIKKHGPVNETKKTFYPIFDYNKARMVQTLYDAKVKLPPDYRLFGRSFDGIDYRFLKPIREHYLEDYEKILEFFPLAELEIERHDYRVQYWSKRQ